MMSVHDRRKFLRVSLGTLGYLSLAACGGGSSDPTSALASTPEKTATTPEVPPMFDVSAATLDGIIARPETFLSVYGSLGGGSTSLTFVQNQLGTQFASLTEPGAIAAFAAAVAFYAAPLGTTALDPQNATMQQLLTSSALTCGHFCKLTTLFALLGDPQMIPPDPAAGAAAKPSVHFLIWLPNVPLNTGNHAQLVITNVLDNAYLLLDPTYAYALRIRSLAAVPRQTSAW